MAKADTFSANVTIDGKKYNFFIVKNDPKPAAAASRPAAGKKQTAAKQSNAA